MNSDLIVENVTAGYGAGLVLQGVDLAVPAGTVVALLGRNGMGKSTLLNGIMGLTPVTSGSIRVGGVELAGAETHRIARHGVAIVPQGRRMFAALTVDETLSVACRRHAGAWSTDRVLELMPGLARRRNVSSGQLSGGEQQMLSIGRALLGQPRVLLLDEPSDGLAPAVVAQVRDVVATLSGAGLTVLLVEQDLRTAFEVSDTIHVMAKGRIVHQASTAEFRADAATAHELLGIGA